MWQAGFDVSLIAWGLNIVALVFGAALGARGLIDPHWAARLVRLRPDEQPGGFAEFRATYGGYFLLLHLGALALSLKWVLNGHIIVGLYAAGAAAPIAAAWAGACGGRVMSMWRDGTRTRFNVISAVVEAGLALMIAAPWALWSFRPPG